MNQYILSKSERRRSLFLSNSDGKAGERLSNITERITELVAPLAREYEYRLVDVEYAKEGKNWFLRLFIDKDAGIALDDCTFFSEKVSELLDTIEPDPIPYAYYLEVSSPGAERPLKTESDWIRAEGEYIQVTLHGPVEGESVFQGTLEELKEESIVLSYRVKTREKTIELNRNNIAKARFAVQF